MHIGSTQSLTYTCIRKTSRPESPFEKVRSPFFNIYITKFNCQNLSTMAPTGRSPPVPGSAGRRRRSPPRRTRRIAW